MANKKKESAKTEKTHFCFFCGKQIIREPIYIQTKRRSELWLHPECVKAGPGSIEKG